MKKNEHRRFIWQKEHIDSLRDLSRIYTDEEIAQIMSTKFGRVFTKVSVRRKRNKLRLRKFGGKKPGIKSDPFF